MEANSTTAHSGGFFSHSSLNSVQCILSLRVSWIKLYSPSHPHLSVRSVSSSGSSSDYCSPLLLLRQSLQLLRSRRDSLLFPFNICKRISTMAYCNWSLVSLRSLHLLLPSVRQHSSARPLGQTHSSGYRSSGIGSHSVDPCFRCLFSRLLLSSSSWRPLFLHAPLSGLWTTPGELLWVRAASTLHSAYHSESGYFASARQCAHRHDDWNILTSSRCTFVPRLQRETGGDYRFREHIYALLQTQKTPMSCSDCTTSWSFQVK